MPKSKIPAYAPWSRTDEEDKEVLDALNAATSDQFKGFLASLIAASENRAKPTRQETEPTDTKATGR
jgi:hypothetical protein